MLTIPGLEESEGLVHGFSTIDFGSLRRESDDEEPLTEGRRRFAESLGVQPERITYAGCTHSTLVARVDEPSGIVSGVDGLITDRPGLPLFSLYADCLPLVVHSAQGRCLGLGHAGWRGTAGGLGKALVTAMVGEYGCDPAELSAGIGPGICGRCYEVGEEVAARFPPEVMTRGGRVPPYFLDLVEANRLALIEAGLEAERIHLSAVCTYESELLFSHRRDGDQRRFAGLVSLL